MQLLLLHGADLLVRDAGDNATPLHGAAQNGHLETVRLLVAHGADVNATDDLHRRGPLGWAACFGAMPADVAAYLIEQGARLDIFAAIALGDTAAVRRLVAADPDSLQLRMSKYDGRQTPLRFAVARDRIDLAGLLLDMGAPPDLTAAWALGRPEEAEAVLAAGVEQAELDATLVWAADNGRVRIAALLLDRGADVDARGGLVLLSAPWHGHPDVVRLLASRGADLDAADAQHRSTPLGWVAFHGFPGLAEDLLAAGAGVDAPNRYGATPLALARSDQRAQVGVTTPREDYEAVERVLQRYGAVSPA